MARYRAALPQMTGGLFLTDGGIETTLIFHEGLELPDFAAFHLLKTADGRAIVLSKSGNDRAIGGSSSGAICAFTAAWERPDAFRRVFSAIGTYVGLRGGNDYPTLIRKVEPKPIRVYKVRSMKIDSGVLVREDDPSDTIFFVADGLFEVYVFASPAGKLKIGQLGPGDVIGEISWLDRTDQHVLPGRICGGPSQLGQTPHTGARRRGYRPLPAW